jgi:uncharacterized membrane protein YhaH (DUF805 family)
MYSFSEAVGRGFAQAFDFRSRAARSEYWFWVLFVFLLSLAAQLADALVYGQGTGPFYPAVALALLIPGLAYGVRRFHDLGRSGWWVLLVLVPLVGPVITAIWFLFRGEAGTNRFGPDPLEEGA